MTNQELEDKKLVMNQDEHYYDEEIIHNAKSEEEYTSNYESKMTSTNRNKTHEMSKVQDDIEEEYSNSNEQENNDEPVL